MHSKILSWGNITKYWYATNRTNEIHNPSQLLVTWLHCNSCLADCKVRLRIWMIPRVYTGLYCQICSVFHTLTREPVGQICFQFPFVFIYKLLHMSNTLLPYCFLCLPGVNIVFLCNLQITNSFFSLSMEYTTGHKCAAWAWNFDMYPYCQACHSRI